MLVEMVFWALIVMTVLISMLIVMLMILIGGVDGDDGSDRGLDAVSSWMLVSTRSSVKTWMGMVPVWER